MATFNYVLGKKKGNGRYPIYLKVRNGETNTMRSLDIEVVKSEWNAKSQRISIRKTDEYNIRLSKEQDNEVLDGLLSRAMEVERELKKRGVLKELSAKELMEAIVNYNPNSEYNDAGGDFVYYWQEVAQRTPKSQEKHLYALKLVVNIQIALHGTSVIKFQDITTDWVASCLAYMKNAHQFTKGGIPKNLSPQSVQTYASCLKKVLNTAIDAGKLPLEVMRGFRNFKPNIVVEKPFTLSIEELREFLHYPFATMRQRMMRDLFFFSFCTMGMNLTDIFHLDRKCVKWSGDEGEINYIRNKTSKLIQVKINSHAYQIQKLIEPYCCHENNVWNNKKITSNHYFALYHNYFKYHTFAGNFQKVGREVREIMGYPEKFTFYTARDSWATILSDDYQLGQEYVDAGLGHSSKSLAANHYIAVDYEKLYTAHADILLRLFE